jgi:hypothetical protein
MYMNKTYLMLLGALAVAGVVGLFVIGKGTPASAPVVPQTQETAGTMADTMKGKMSMKHSLRDFLGMGGQNLKCTSTFEDASTKTEGVAYVSAGKVRTDSVVTIKKDGSTETSSSIIDSDYMYAWGGQMEKGMKMNLLALKDMEARMPQGDTKNMQSQTDLDTSYDYTCETWTPDASFFALPAGITFTDYTEMMKGMGTMMQDMKKATDVKVDLKGASDAGMMNGEMMNHSSMPAGGAPANSAAMCAACEQAPTADAKAQCRAALQCK